MLHSAASRLGAGLSSGPRCLRIRPIESAVLSVLGTCPSSCVAFEFIFERESSSVAISAGLDSTSAGRKGSATGTYIPWYVR